MVVRHDFFCGKHSIIDMTADFYVKKTKAEMRRCVMRCKAKKQHDKMNYLQERAHTRFTHTNTKQIRLPVGLCVHTLLLFTVYGLSIKFVCNFPCNATCEQCETFL